MLASYRVCRSARAGRKWTWGVRSAHSDTMQARLEALGYAVESGWDFGKGNRAIYLDDPDGNVVELTERRTLWDGNPATE